MSDFHTNQDPLFMANLVYIATSLDGYIAGENGDIEWLESFPTSDIQEGDYGFNDFMQRVDALLMGRNTFEKVLSFGDWPYEKMVFVLSSTLEEVPEHVSGKAEVINGAILEVLHRLHERGYKNLYIDGGKVIQSFLQQNLIDEMFITRLPILLGKGIPLFGEMENQVRFEKVDTIQLNQYLVMSHYRR